MKVGVAKETAPGERRVALVPEVLGKLKAAGLDILVERGAGAGSSIPDGAYQDAGATVVSTDDLYRDADAILRVAKPSDKEIGKLRKGQALLALKPKNLQVTLPYDIWTQWFETLLAGALGGVPVAAGGHRKDHDFRVGSDQLHSQDIGLRPHRWNVLAVDRVALLQREHRFSRRQKEIVTGAPRKKLDLRIGLALVQFEAKREFAVGLVSAQSSGLVGDVCLPAFGRGTRQAGVAWSAQWPESDNQQANRDD
jgi:hypothetical protein